jgi:hypothetical protein
MMKPAVHIMVGSKEMHDNMEKALMMMLRHVRMHLFKEDLQTLLKKNAV